MNTYLNPLKQAFVKGQNPEIAVQMKKYMRGQYAYFGIKAPQRSAITRTFLSEYGLPGDDQLEPIVKQCWDQPEREFQYFAMELLVRIAKKAELCRVDFYEYLILSKSWWDTVDYMASNLVGVHFQKFPDVIQDYTTKWMNSGNIWLQRTSLIFQLKYKQHTDLELLDRNIRQLEGSHEFFINKAIGWALRQYSKTDAQWVINYVKQNQDMLDPLSQREAVKWLVRKGLILTTSNSK